MLLTHILPALSHPLFLFFFCHPSTLILFVNVLYYWFTAIFYKGNAYSTITLPMIHCYYINFVMTLLLHTCTHPEIHSRPPFPPHCRRMGDQWFSVLFNHILCALSHASLPFPFHFLPSLHSHLLILQMFILLFFKSEAFLLICINNVRQTLFC